jgi:hypothetical protein
MTQAEIAGNARISAFIHGSENQAESMLPQLATARVIIDVHIRKNSAVSLSSRRAGRRPIRAKRHDNPQMA